MLVQDHEASATFVYCRKPFGLLVPSPLTNAAPSCAANTCSTSAAIHSSRFTAASSSSVALAAGIAYNSIAGNESSASVGVVVCVRSPVSAAQPAAGPPVMNGFL